MRLTELLNGVWFEQPKVCLLATATNGLHGYNDKLLGFAIQDVSVETPQVFLKYTVGEDLQKSSQYHKISQIDMQSRGLQKADFDKALKDTLLEHDIVFTYNVSFQSTFIAAQDLDLDRIELYELSIVEKALRNKYAFDSEQLATFSSFYGACCEVAAPVPIATVCRNLHMSKDPAPGQLPMERMVEVLQQLWLSASSQDIVQLQS